MIEANASGKPSTAPRSRRSARRGWPPTPARSSGRPPRGSLAAFGASRDQVPEAGAEVGAAEERVRGDADEQHDRDGLAHGTDTSSRARSERLAAGRRAHRRRRARARNRRLMPRSMSTRDPSDDVEDDHARRTSSRRPCSRSRRPRPSCAEDDPGLSPDLGDDPPGLHRDHRERRPRPPRSAGTTCSAACRGGRSTTRQYQSGEQEEQRAEADHHVPGEVDRVDLATRRAGRPPGTCSGPARPWRCRRRVGQPRGQTRDRDAAADRPSEFRWPKQRLGDVARRSRGPARSPRTSRVRCCTPSGRAVAHAHLDRRGDRGDGEGMMNPRRW